MHEDLGVVELTPAHDDADDIWSELLCAGREVLIGLSNVCAIDAFFDFRSGRVVEVMPQRYPNSTAVGQSRC